MPKFSLEQFLEHSGVKGMKWGVRKDPKSSGSRTSTESSKISSLSDSELRAKVNRLNLEKQYNDLTTPKNNGIAKKGATFVTSVLHDAGKQVATQVVKKQMLTYIERAGISGG